MGIPALPYPRWVHWYFGARCRHALERKVPGFVGSASVRETRVGVPELPLDEGEPIRVARLLAIPMATRCAACQQRLEQELRLGRNPAPGTAPAQHA